MKETKINRLRRKFSDNSINLVDIAKYIDPTKNKVLIDLITNKIIETSILAPERISENISNISHLVSPDVLKDQTTMDNISNNILLTSVLEIVHKLIGDDNIYCLNRFKKYWDENKVSHNMQNYQSFDDIVKVVYTLDMEVFKKNNSKAIQRIYEDDKWAVIMPLSYEAAKVYGYGTKWCTSAANNTDSFFRYTKRGILIYIINKKDNEKFAYYKRKDERMGIGESISQIFNQQDLSFDSIDLPLDHHILLSIKDFLRTAPYKSNSEHENYSYVGEEVVKECEAMMDIVQEPQEYAPNAANY